MNNKMIMYFFLMIISVSLTFISAKKVKAEAVYTKDGRIIYGKIIYQDKKKMILNSRYGKITIHKKRIKKVDYDQGLGTVAVLMKGNKSINGTLITITSKHVIVREDDGNNVQHRIPKGDIESLFLRKFAGRRDNMIALSGGVVINMGEVGNTVPYVYQDFTLHYMSPFSFSTYLYWGVSASYMYFTVEGDDSPLREANFVQNPLLFNLEYRYPFMRSFSSGIWARNLKFSVLGGFGATLVTLSDSEDTQTNTYPTFQAGAGFSYTISDRVHLMLQSMFVYIHQQDLSYYGIRNHLGIGYIF